MRKTIPTILILLAATLHSATAQTYTTLWKQADEASAKDLPQTEVKLLRQIAVKAEKEKAYGQLLKAELKAMRLQMGVAPDSLRPAVAAFEQKEQKTKDAALRGVFRALLYKMYSTYGAELGEGSEAKAEAYRAKAVENPAKLAATKAADYAPFVEDGVDSKYFNDDLLSVVGWETENYRALSQYYYKAGNRAASCLAGLHSVKRLKEEVVGDFRKSQHIYWLDSLIHVFGDLDVAGEVAVERYNYMERCAATTAEDKIKYIHYALDRWGTWKRMGELRNAERTLTQPQYTSSVARQRTLPDSAQWVRHTDLRNIASLTMRVYRTPLNGDTPLDPSASDDYRKLKPQLTLIPSLTQTHTYVGQPDYQLFTDSMRLAGLKPGVYLIEMETTPATQTDRMLYYVSGVSVVGLPLPGDKVRYAVVDAATGHPLAGAHLKLTLGSRRYGREPKTATLTTDKQGEAIYRYSKDARPTAVFAYTDTDKAAPTMNTWGGYNHYERQDKQERTMVMTDRAIYRPGQTVHVAAVVYENTNKIDNAAVEGKKVKAVLRNANYEVVEERELTTDAYGTCSADFALPTAGLTGRYTVVVNGFSAAFRVEEYKRPTFQVEFPKVSEKYQAGDTLLVRGTAASFAGVPVQNGKVNYTVRRTPAYWWLSYCSRWLGGNDEGETLLWEKQTTTDAEGKFTVELPLLLPGERDKVARFYNFTVVTDVTDAAGESHSGELSIPLGSRTTAFTSSLAPQMLADSLGHITFHLRNAAGHEAEANVRFRFDGESLWFTAKTSEPYKLNERFATGRHRLFAICERDTIDQQFIVFSLDDAKPCADGTKEWFYASAGQFPIDGRPVTVQVGSSDADLHIIYNVFSGNTVVESGTTKLSDALINRKLSYKDEYGDGLTLAYAWVRDGQAHTWTTSISRPLPPDELKLSWETFRDRLTPGQQETWTLRIDKPDGTPADAQLMATLYDKSLDQLAKHRWSLNPSRYVWTPNTEWQTAHSHGRAVSGSKPFNYLTVRQLDLSHFVDDISYSWHAYSRGDMVMLAGGQRMYRHAALASNKMMAMAMDSAESEEEKSEASTAKPVATVDALGSQGIREEHAEESVRENLSELAYFAPALQASKDGKVALSFTLPEALTTWRVMGIAHTRDMMHGYVEGEAVAQKAVMVQPNVPRFVRTGDKATISARIFNTSTKPVSGTARLQLIDPTTEATVHEQSLPFTVETGKTAAVTFAYEPSGEQPLLVCKVTASGAGFSDGEQHYLPVLPNRERVTATVPFTQHGPGTKTIDLAKLFPEGTSQQRLTIEYTANPAWLMVQALPYVGNARNDNAIDQAATLYANALGQSLVGAAPQVKATFEAWKHEQGTATSLHSQLEKNQELKDIVLAETPWVQDAKDEAGQKRHLADFFDGATMQSRRATALSQLARLQNADGSWSWWRGMDGSTYITVEVAEMLARLNALAGEQAATKQMLRNAMAYLDKEMAKEVARMKAEEKKGHAQVFPGSEALHYLYIKALQQSTSHSSTDNYLINLLKKEIKGQAIGDKALTAIILHRQGDRTRSREYAQSLKEHTVYTEEMGRYYDTRRAAYSWCDYKIPTQVAAIEALQTVTPTDTATIDEMRRWLLQEKRTQAWDTPINSVNAVYAFLSNAHSPRPTPHSSELKIDGQALEAAPTAGLGYMKTTIDQPHAKAFTATKRDGGTSWGAVYAQYMEKSTKAESRVGELSVKRELLTPRDSLKVGARVRVRITIEAKRDLDFVQVTDKRAACMEPTSQASGYQGGYYIAPKDNATHYFFNQMAKGRHAIETEYYLDRAGLYTTGTLTAQCAYAPEYKATAKGEALEVK